MKIPSDAIIAREKLTHYLLVYRKKNDKSRFLAQAGFTHGHPDVLEAAIRRLIAENEAIEDGNDQYGSYYRVTGNLTGPTGTLNVVTIWIMQVEQEDNESEYRFVTLKPERNTK
jgi:hypothetical protein